MVCFFASTVGFNPNVPRTFEVSGPMDASFIPGNFFSKLGKSNRV
jgi:hypothetical protein